VPAIGTYALEPTCSWVPRSWGGQLCVRLVESGELEIASNLIRTRGKPLWRLERLVRSLRAVAEHAGFPDAPGWYSDPDGRYQHEAYWDGEKWTGATRRPATAGVLFESRPDLRLVAQVLLGVLGFSVAPLLVVNGLVSVIGFFGEPTDFRRAFNPPTLFGLILVAWTFLGITKPTPMRYFPPTVGSLALIVWFFFIY
jgi:hypothetical protein